MLKPSIPENEEFRINKLFDYSILDSLPEEDYDFIVRIAAQICGTPISLISFVDEKRQWFKANFGLADKETPRDISFCAHAINKPYEVFKVSDAKNDSRFMDNPLVTSNPNIGFYAGVPLVSDDGYALGSLCVIDHKPRELSDHQIAALKGLSKQVINLLELRRQKIELERVNKFLKFKNKELEEFTYITSHDLQEPLRTITSLLEIIKISYNDKIDEKGQEMIRYVVEAGARMKGLIMGLLDYSRLGKERVINLINLNDTVNEAISDLSKSIQDTKAQIKVEVLPKLNGFKTELRLLFQNIISNALKYKHPERNPVINISCFEEKDYFKFCISDNGIGIPNEFKTKIFKIFQRLHGRNEYEGYGLGLTHCRKIIELHNGKIWVNSVINEGSQFYFTIPKNL